jgi:hypothetical protein
MKIPAKRAFLFLAGLTLAGCQSAAEKHAAETGEIEASNASLDDLSGLLKAAKEKTAMRPGMWQTESQLVTSDLSGLPEENRAEMLATLKRQERSVARCAKADELKTLDFKNLEQAGAQCTVPRYVAKGGKVDGEIHCELNGKAIVLKEQGSLTPTGYDVTVDQATGQPGQDGYITYRLHYRGKRLGECAG